MIDKEDSGWNARRTRRPHLRTIRSTPSQRRQDHAPSHHQPLASLLHSRPETERKEGHPLMATATVVRELSPAQAAAQERAALCAQIAEENKARDVLVLDMRGLTPLYDFLVLATAQGKRQMHAISEEIDQRLTQMGDRRHSLEGYQACRWIVQDYGDLVVHLFDPLSRDFYRLDDLWADAPRVDWRRV